MTEPTKLFEVYLTTDTNEYVVCWPTTPGHKTWCTHDTEAIEKLAAEVAQLKLDDRALLDALEKAKHG
jgi:hypothetical protein